MAANQNPMVVVVVIVITTIVLALTVVPGLLKSRREKRIRETGVSGTGTVLEIHDTGSRSGHDPVCRVVLSIEATGQEPWKIEKEMTLSAVDLMKFKEGSVVPVKFDPAAPSEVLVIR